MPLRNGNEYLVAHKCQKCLKFYSNAEFDYLCSGCSPNFKRETPDYTERKAQLEGWLMAKTLPPGDKKMTSIIKRAARNDMLLLTILRQLCSGGYLLRSEFALSLLGGVKRGHIVAPFVCDWWNIRTDMGWPSYLVCYYGDFDNKIPPKCPPRGPRGMLHCTETVGLYQFSRKAGLSPGPCCVELK